MINVPSPALAFVGRHNSGKTTFIEKVIAQLVAHGYNVGSIKHHSHVGFDIDKPGKDSYRHRAAGSCDVIISAPGCTARITDHEADYQPECSELVASMPNHDIVIVEGYRKSGLPCVEVMRAANPADRVAADAFLANAAAYEDSSRLADAKMGEAQIGGESFSTVREVPCVGETTVAIVTDMPDVAETAARLGIAVFGLEDVEPMVAFIEDNFIRPRMTVVIQSGGESRRMGQNKALVPFAGRPLMCRMIDRLAPIADELIITTNEPEKLQSIVDAYPQYDIRLVRDLVDRRGSVAGFYTALKSAHHRYVAVVACDMVFASPALIIAESMELKERHVDAVVPHNSHGFEPFHGVYRADKCLPKIEPALHLDNLGEECREAGTGKRDAGFGVRRVQDLLDLVNVYWFPSSRIHDVAPMGGCFVNANTPEELAAYEAIVMAEEDNE